MHKVKISNNFDLEKTLTCGQCFRWKRHKNGFIGIVEDKPLEIEQRKNTLIVSCSKQEFNTFWNGYFSLDLNYDEIAKKVNLEGFAKESYEFSKGMNILRQPLFETSISFIISQRNSIPRIESTIEKMSMDMGQKIKDNLYTFPTPHAIINSDLSPYKLGYRDKYILEFSQKVADNPDYLENLESLESQQLIEALKENKGIGDKVANCIALLGYNRLDVFPIDTWIQKVIDKYYNGKIDPTQWSPYQGLIEQYIFYYIRNKDLN